MKQIVFLLCILTNMFVAAHAQIGYQIALLNTATGEAKANTSVNATVTITDSANGVVYTGTQRVTSNDFGILSLVIGDANTFSNVDTSKMPFFIEVSVDGTLIGKSQILSVPVAEVAKRLKSSLSVEDLVGRWQCDSADGVFVYTFTSDGKWIYKTSYGYTSSGTYKIEGDDIIVIGFCNEYTGIPYFKRARILYGYLIFEDDDSEALFVRQ